MAEAGPPQTVKPGARVTLDGSQSWAPGGATLAFHWTQTSGDPVALSGDRQEQASFLAAREGVYGFQLEVDDGSQTAVDFAQVRVSADAQGCGCNQPGAAASGLWTLVCLLWLVRRERSPAS